MENMEFDKLKKGDYVKWVANRTIGGVTYKSWDTFGKIISKDKEKITVMTYDDFKKTDLSKSGDAVREEISLATKWNVSVIKRLLGCVREIF
jgi:hypothetical protein